MNWSANGSMNVIGGRAGWDWVREREADDDLDEKRRIMKREDIKQIETHLKRLQIFFPCRYLFDRVN